MKKKRNYRIHGTVVSERDKIRERQKNPNKTAASNFYCFRTNCVINI
jgi:hypothetical protein